MRYSFGLGMIMLCGWGCSDDLRCGPGTVGQQGVCLVQDAGLTPDAGVDSGSDGGTDEATDAGDGSDGGVTSDAGFEPGDVLIVDPGTIVVVQGFMQCVGITVRRADSSLVVLSPDTVQVELTGPGAAFAILGEPGDCARAEKFAVIATGEGRAALTFKVGALTFPASIEVIAAEVRAEAQGAVGNTVALNRPVLIQGPLFYPRAYVQGQRVMDGEPVPRYIGIAPDDASILAIEATTGGDFIFTGLQVGSTAVHPTYAGSTASYVPDSGNTQVVDGGTLLLVRTRLYRLGAWTPPRAEELTVGACFDLVLEGRFEAGGIYFSGEITPANFTAVGLAEDAAGHFCIEAAGVISATGCETGLCHTIEFLVPPAEIVGVRMVPSSAPPFLEQSPFRLCPPLDVFVDFADNTSIDVTLSRVYDLLMIVPNSTSQGDDIWTEFRDPLTGDLDLEGGYRCLTNGSRAPGATLPCVFQASVGLAGVEQSYDVTF